MGNFPLLLLFFMGTIGGSVASLFCVLQQYTRFTDVAAYAKYCDYVTPARITLEGSSFKHMYQGNLSTDPNSSVFEESKRDRSYVPQLKRENKAVQLIISIHLEASHESTYQAPIDWTDFEEIKKYFIQEFYSGFILSFDEKVHIDRVVALLNKIVTMKRQYKNIEKITLFVKLGSPADWDHIKEYDGDINYYIIPSFLSNHNTIQFPRKLIFPDYKENFKSWIDLQLPKSKLFGVLDLNLYQEYPRAVDLPTAYVEMRRFWDSGDYIINKQINFTRDADTGMGKGELDYREKTYVWIDTIDSIEKRIDYYRSHNVNNYIFYGPGRAPNIKGPTFWYHVYPKQVEILHVELLHDLLNRKDVSYLEKLDQAYIYGLHPWENLPRKEYYKRHFIFE